jgi:hypothetical protein
MLESRSNRIIIATFIALCLFLFVLILGVNQKSASAGLPPRPEPSPTAPPKSSNPGGNIELVYDGVPVGPNGVWTAVQWQDPYTEKWTTVEGWQGTIDLDGTQRWWVAPSEFGKGPFRWLVYDKQDGKLLETSEPFTMPAGNHQVVIVEITVEDAE